MSRLRRWREAVAHAFSTQPPPLSAEEAAAIARLATSVRAKGLTTAALVALETARPVAGVAGHTVTFAAPVMRPLAEALDVDLDTVARLVGNRRALEYLVDRLSDEDDP